jgi:arginase family enzyme
MIDFLIPVSKSVIAHKEVLPAGVLGKQILIHSEKGELPDLEEVKFAIIGIKENRNDVDYMGEEIHFDSCRKAFYSLFPGNWKYKIADLGDIEKGASVSDTYFAMRTVINELIGNKIIPLLLGGSQDLVMGQYRSYDSFGTMVNIVNVDSRFDLGAADQPISNISYVGKLIVDKPYNLFNYCVLVYQSYFNPPEEINLMDKLFFDAYRLGEVSAEIKKVEPIFRNADIVSVDIGAIKSSELSYKSKSSPNGFDGKEICTIARYAGISNKVSSFGVYEIKNLVDIDNAAMLIAQVLWYFIEGVNFRVKDDDFNNEKHYTNYKVMVDDEILLFKKSNKTGRWWLELPFISNVNNKLKSKTLLP